ncbi:peptide/nickel transport system permease protein [Streptomyces zhaozhouensis]|uniref:Peptide/nickel transport system permease protein n=1 Tax=Streptomyces zhaozhouensis TaxID=1300267 RepID=A0A286DVJ1_9ACTN|nr:ABC transporter permease [Streptomyces zhaozhouensis]SOD62672.1 peptide/nickel transport system permease protein [Streptomyces zhaozhouensis]
MRPASPGTGAREALGPLAWCCAGVCLLVLAVAVLGPPLAPGSPTEQVGPPFAGPGAGLPLGTDFLGRDLAARLLHGGWVVLALAVGATALATLLGAGGGIWLGLAAGRGGEIVMRAVDLLAVFPPLLLMLLLATGAPAGDLAVLVAVGLAATPFSLRVTRAATRRVAATGYVLTARARGDGWTAVVRYDVLPNIAGTVLADAGIRFVAAVHLTATAGFLGLGRGAPDANWGRMIRENLPGAALNPLPVLLPAALLAAFAVAVNLLADRVAERVAGLDTSGSDG